MEDYNYPKGHSELCCILKGEIEAPHFYGDEKTYRCFFCSDKDIVICGLNRIPWCPSLDFLMDGYVESHEKNKAFYKKVLALYTDPPPQQKPIDVIKVHKQQFVRKIKVI
jgi:hypothetical protein